MMSRSKKKKKAKKEVNLPAPSLRYLLLEGRTVFEWASSFFVYPMIPKRADGDGRPVLIFPPLLGNDLVMKYLRRFLEDQNFVPYKWDMGVNLVRDNYLPKLEEKLLEIYEKHEQKVSLIGWSAGGIFARVLANKHPKMVDQIVTIATPFRGIRNGQTNVDLIFEILNGRKKSDTDKKLLKLIETTPPVPTTCIYTTTDGIVTWRHCYEKEEREDVKNIEVFGSHGGLGVNPAVLIFVAETLANKNDRPSEDELPNGFAQVLYPSFWSMNKQRV